jgi:hypothetical protein
MLKDSTEIAKSVAALVDVGLKDSHQPTKSSAENADKVGDRRVHLAKYLADELFATRQVGQILHTIGIDKRSLQICPVDDNVKPVLLDVSHQRTSRPDRVIRAQHKACRADDDFADFGTANLVRGDLDQRVLCHAVSSA